MLLPFIQVTYNKTLNNSYHFHQNKEVQKDKNEIIDCDIPSSLMKDIKFRVSKLFGKAKS